MTTTHIDHPVDFAQDPANLTYTFGGASPVAEVTTVKSWEVVYLPSAETMRVTPDQGPSRA